MEQFFKNSFVLFKKSMSISETIAILIPLSIVVYFLYSWLTYKEK